MGLPQEIELAPLTLFFGPNSAGKSTVSRALRFLAQSVKDGRELAYSGDLVDLKTFEATVFGQGSGVIRLGLELARREMGQTNRSPFGTIVNLDWEISSDCPELPSSVRIAFAESHWETEALNQLVLDFSIDTTGRATLQNFECSREVIDFIERSSSQETVTAKDLEVAARDSEFSIGADNRHRPRSPLVPSWRGERLNPESNAERLLDRILRSAEDLLATNLVGLAYCGPLRSIASEAVRPQRLAGPIESDASNIQAVLASMENAEFERLSMRLHHLTDGGYKLERVPLSADIPQSTKKVQTFLKDLTTNALVSFDDAGVGLAQVLPVLVHVFGQIRGSRGANSTHQARGLLHRRAGTVYVEQPELHLHPKMQAKLADFCLDFSRITDDRAERNPTIVCETHSEQFLVRVQKRIREQAYPTDKVAVYFVDRFPGTKSSYIQRLRISETGEFLDEWPVSFSSLRLADIIDS